MATTPPVVSCRVCGHEPLHFNPVLWERLIADWQLAPAEVAYLDRQQGLHCTRCGAVLRTMALAEAIGRAIGVAGPLTEVMASERARGLRVLDINAAAGISTVLEKLPRYRRLSYPEVDMMALDLPDGEVDLILHSDTLEHVPEPRRALAECRRALAPGGACCFTVPIVVGRLSRNRAGLPKSYHGAPGIELDDFVVHTEFGADAWTMVIEAGFRSCEIVSLEYPAGIAIKAQR